MKFGAFLRYSEDEDRPVGIDQDQRLVIGEQRLGFRHRHRGRRGQGRIVGEVAFQPVADSGALGRDRLEPAAHGIFQGGIAPRRSLSEGFGELAVQRLAFCREILIVADNLRERAGAGGEACGKLVDRACRSRCGCVLNDYETFIDCVRAANDIVVRGIRHDRDINALVDGTAGGRAADMRDGLAVFASLVCNCRQVAQEHAGPLVGGAVQLFAHRGRAPVQRFGLFGAAAPFRIARHVVERLGNEKVLGSVISGANLQDALLHLLFFLQASGPSVDDGKIVERVGDIRMVAALGLFQDRGGARKFCFGIRQSILAQVSLSEIVE